MLHATAAKPMSLQLDMLVEKTKAPPERTTVITSSATVDADSGSPSSVHEKTEPMLARSSSQAALDQAKHLSGAEVALKRQELSVSSPLEAKLPGCVISGEFGNHQ